MNTKLTGFRWFSKSLNYILVLWNKVVSALEGLMILCDIVEEEYIRFPYSRLRRLPNETCSM